jgi:ribosomal protein S18 acetylase RimI-like enzyme
MLRSHGMSFGYFKRFRMELVLRGRRLAPVQLPPAYALLPWLPERLTDHAEAKFHSFRNEIDADVFLCLAEPGGCYRLMEEISRREGFVPEATWLAVYRGRDMDHPEPCGTIQGVRASDRYGSIQNVGVTPEHRGCGIGTALIVAALTGFQQAGLPRAYLEVTARNGRAVQLYRRLGFKRTKTLYRAVELAYS